MLQQPRIAPDAAALVLFTAGNIHGNEQQRPVWVYKDHHGSLQGPFSAANMLQWYSTQRLPPDLLVCGITPQSASLPLDAIPVKFFQSLGHLISATAAGRQYSPLLLNNASAQTMATPKIQTLPGTLRQAAIPQQSATPINAGVQMRAQHLNAIGGINPGQHVITGNVPNAVAQLRAGGALMRQGMAGAAGASQQLMQLAPMQQQRQAMMQPQQQQPNVVFVQHGAQGNQPPADLLHVATASNMPAAAGRQVVVVQPQQAQQAPAQSVSFGQGQLVMQPIIQQQQQQRPSQHVVLQQLAPRAGLAPVQGVQGALQPPAGQQSQLAVQQQVQAGITTAGLAALMQDARSAQQRQQMALAAVTDQNRQLPAAEVMQQRLQRLPAAAGCAGNAADGSALWPAAARVLQQSGQLISVGEAVEATSTVMATLPGASIVVPQPRPQSIGHSSASIVSLLQGQVQGQVQGPLPAVSSGLHARARGPMSAASSAGNTPRTSMGMASSSMNNLQQLVKQATAMSDRPAIQGIAVSMPSTCPIAATAATAGALTGGASLLDTAEGADLVWKVNEGVEIAEADVAIDDILFDLMGDVAEHAGEERQPCKQGRQPTAQPASAATAPAAVEEAVAVYAAAAVTSSASNMAAGSRLPSAIAVGPTASAGRSSLLSPSNQLLAQAGDKHAIEFLLKQQQRQQLQQLGQQAGTAGMQVPNTEIAALKQAALPAGASGVARLQGVPAASAVIQQKLQGLDTQRQQQLLLVQAQHQQLLAQQQHQLFAEQRQQQVLAAQQQLLAQQQQQQVTQQQQELREQLAHLQQQQQLQLQHQKAVRVQAVNDNNKALLASAEVVLPAASAAATVAALAAGTKGLPGATEVQEDHPLQQSANDARLGPADAVIALQQFAKQQQKDQEPPAAAAAQSLSASEPEQQAIRAAAEENGLGAFGPQLGGCLFSMCDISGGAKQFNPWAMSLIDPSVVVQKAKPRDAASAADQGSEFQQGQAASLLQPQRQQQAGETSKQITEQQEKDIMSALMPELAALGLTLEQQLQVLKQMLGMKQQQQANRKPVADVPASPQQQNQVTQQQQPQQPQAQPPRQQQPQHLWLQHMAAGKAVKAAAKPAAGRSAVAAQGSSAQQQQQEERISEGRASSDADAAGGNITEPASENEEFDASMLPADLFDFLDGHSSPKSAVLNSPEDIPGLAGITTDTWQPRQLPADTAGSAADKPGKYIPPSLRRSSGGGGTDGDSWHPGQPHTSSSSSSGALSTGPRTSYTSGLCARLSAGAYQHPNARARAASPPPAGFLGTCGPAGWHTTPEQEQHILAQQQLLPPHLRIVPQDAAARHDEGQQGEQGARHAPDATSKDDGRCKIRRLFEQAAAAAAATGSQHGAAVALPSPPAAGVAHPPTCRPPPGFELPFPINTGNVDHEGWDNAPAHEHEGLDQGWHGQHSSKGPASKQDFWDDQHQRYYEQQHDGWVNIDAGELKLRSAGRGRSRGRLGHGGRHMGGRDRGHISVEQEQWEETELGSGRRGRPISRPELESWGGYDGGSRGEQDAFDAWQQQQDDEHYRPAAYGRDRRVAPGKHRSYSAAYKTEAAGYEATGYDSSFLANEERQEEEVARYHRVRMGRMPAGSGRSHPYQQQPAGPGRTRQLYAADLEQEVMEGSLYPSKPGSHKRPHPGSPGTGREASAAAAVAAAAAAMGVHGSKRSAKGESALDITWQQQALLNDYDPAAAPTAGPESKPAGIAKWDIREPYEYATDRKEQHRFPVGVRCGTGHMPESGAQAPQPSQHLRSAAQNARGRAAEGDSEHNTHPGSSASALGGGGKNYAEFLKQLKSRQQGQEQQGADSSSSHGLVVPHAMAAAVADVNGCYTGEPAQSPSGVKDAAASAAAAAMAAVQGLKPFCTVAPPRTGKAPKKQSSGTSVTSPSGRMQGTAYAPLSNQLPSIEETKAAVMAALGAGPTVSTTNSGSSSTFHHDALPPQQDSGAFWRGVGVPGGSPESSGGSGTGGDPAGAAPRRGGGSGSLFSSVIGQLRKQATTVGRSDSSGDWEGVEVYATSPPDTNQSPQPYQRTHAPSYALAVAHSATPAAASSYLVAASTGSGRRGGPVGDSSAADIVLAAIQTTRQRAHVHSQRTHAKMGPNGRCKQATDSTGKADAAWREADTWDA